MDRVKHSTCLKSKRRSMLGIIFFPDSFKAPLEFTACKKISDKLDSSLMILSELCGANRAFTGFLEFNPFNVIL